ncbi:pentapeptide repeat-containing protein [Streptosporangium sp. NPDC004379]|uniref:pentapeptide repeat-containing protein n=1 Tax=Streptosporangium sp. NPDC004379 TaxID=3366189 RepID=UPI0036C65DA8
MSASGPFDLRPGPEEWRSAWIARGEFRDRRFEPPAGVSTVTFDRARLVNVDFSGMRFTDFSVHDSTFEGCDFSGAAFERLSLGLTGMPRPEGGMDRPRSGFRPLGAVLGRLTPDRGTRVPRSGADWPRSVFRDCVFRRTRFAPLTFFGNVRFENCTFDRSRLTGQTLTFEAEFVGCVFLGRVRNVNFWGRPSDHERGRLGRDRNDFTGNDFTGAELDDVAFRHIDLRAQRFPGPPGHAILDRIGERVDAVLPLVERWPDPRHRETARSCLEFLADEAAEYNDDEALVSPSRMGPKLPPALREELFEALRRTPSGTSPG